ncbi:MAG: hypothetical protein ACYYK0_05605 [Candidatus Eutrophobiaceae bacterium]
MKKNGRQTSLPPAENVASLCLVNVILYLEKIEFKIESVFMNIKSVLKPLALSVYLMFGASGSAETEDIVVDYRFPAFLVSGWLDMGKVALLLDGTTSPHDFQLKPSQMRLMQESMIFGIDDNIETFRK